ncbi:M48 family metallopeptidase [Wenzhouxiangella sp. XN201]|uniref:M48 family metallopeptidase n=1 Tax=Wenzhouxiangella sp. XN201 TaxID=2710755 RepID=UPI0013CC82FC|nr:SprT family zinc-dependent metalloprotease [Wenzhouxiangella sp. XN201]NEZ03005.1 M48 family metallopeptidase [Wenzhouxiangella sp. XN201]
MTYRLRHHPRARRVKLRVERDGALVVTAPRGVRRGEVDRFVATQEGWIARVRERLARQRAGRDPAMFGLRPMRIELPALGEHWCVVYGEGEEEVRHCDSERPGRSVHLPANESNQATVLRLQDWLKRRARRALTPWVDELAEMHGMDHGRVSFRNQRSRWGSCSSTGNLSLNARLLFCSPEACRYVLIHELVHLEHPNHSPAFWQRVAELCPAYRQHMRELKAVWNALPDWVTVA